MRLTNSANLQNHVKTRARRRRFLRTTPPAFRLTEDDVEILRHIAGHRFVRSTHIAVLVGRSLDRINDRLLRLFHAGLVDRPQAQLSYFPTSGSSPMVYALANEGARLLKAHDGAASSRLDLSRKNKSALRPFIEHQLEIMDFYVALQCAARGGGDMQLIHADEIVASFPDQEFSAGNPFALSVRVSHQGAIHEIGLVPDLVFGLKFPDGSRRCFMVEIDRGTMPIARSGLGQTSYERKMRAYLTAHAAKLHDRHFGWKTFRVLTITTDDHRRQSMMETLRALRIPHSLGPRLFFFATRIELCTANPLLHVWRDGDGRDSCLT